MATRAQPPGYLQPYLSASEKFGAGFGSLLWASPKTQAIRFQALLSAVDVTGQSILDVGCGRADLFQYMINCGYFPKFYTGIEAVDVLAIAAEAKRLPGSRIIRGDFVSHPHLLNVQADVLMYSGSLNTMNRDCFYSCLQAAFTAARTAVVFNFLSLPFLAASSYLTWHEPEEVVRFARGLSKRIDLHEDYLRGDATLAIWKETTGKETV